MCKTYCENLTENLSHNFVLSLITQYGLKPAILRLLKNVKVAFVISKFVVLYLYTKLLRTHFSFSHSHTTHSGYWHCYPWQVGRVTILY